MSISGNPVVQIFGLGYVGLPTAAVFADAGLRVIGVDVNQSAVDSINAGQPHIVEPHLEELLKKVVASGNLHATSCLKNKSRSPSQSARCFAKAGIWSA